MTARSSATRALVSREVAEALMPRDCPHVDCEGEGDTHCWGCHGSGSLPPVLRLLVVEGERHAGPGAFVGKGPLLTTDVPPAIVRAIEAGERIGIDVECTICWGRGTVQAQNDWGLTTAGFEQCPACTGGRVLVGSVRPVKVLPIYGPDTCPGPPSSGAPKHVCIGPFLTDGEEPYPGMMAMRVTHLHDIAPDLTEALSVYGPAESLIGRYAVEVEDARKKYC